MRRVLLIVVGLFLVVGADNASARRESLTADQKDQLRKAQTLLVDVFALTDRGEVDASELRQVVISRLEAVGYTTVTDPAKPHDVHVKVKCEQRKVWEGTMASGGDADLPDSPLRAWRGPACQLTYYLNGKSTQWKKEVRTEFNDAIEAAKQAGATDPGAYALAKLRERLEEYEFPIRLAADWRQDDRLLKVFKDPHTPSARRARSALLLGEIFSAPAVPSLISALKGSDVPVASAAAIALGNIGHKESIAALVDVLKNGDPQLKKTAAKALGKVGALHGDVSIIPPLLDAMRTDDIEIKTEVVWALGQLPDRRAYEPLVALQRSLSAFRTSERQSPEGKLWDAVSYSLKQIDRFDQIN